MTNKNDIVSLLSLYNGHFPQEEARVKLFTAFLHRTDGSALFDRKNFDGHITTSAFIINGSWSQMLLLEHRSLKRWLQPGGHAEDSDGSLLLSALREAVEETGIVAEQLSHFPLLVNSEMPFDIDTHFIPPNPNKAEAGHYHHDLRYLFVYTGAQDHVYNADEATGQRWIALDELEDNETFATVVAKIRNVRVG